MKKILISVAVALAITSCQREWDMTVRTTDTVYENCEGEGVDTMYESSYIFRGSREAASAECGTNYESITNDSVCIDRMIITFIDGEIL